MAARRVGGGHRGDVGGDGRRDRHRGRRRRGERLRRDGRGDGRRRHAARSSSSSRRASATGIIRTPTSPTAPMRSSRGSTPDRGAVRRLRLQPVVDRRPVVRRVGVRRGRAGRDDVVGAGPLERVGRVRGIDSGDVTGELAEAVGPGDAAGVVGADRRDASPVRFHSGSSQSCVSSSRKSVINVPRPPNRAVGRAQVYTSRHATATSGQPVRHDRATDRRRRRRASRRQLDGWAERVGFEPTDHLAMVNALAGRPIRPLWHLSLGAPQCSGGAPTRAAGPSLASATERWQSGQMHPP